MTEFLKENKTLIKLILGIVLVVFTVLIIVLSKGKELTKKEKIKRISTVGIFTAFSFVLYLLKFPFPIFTFLEIQFSNVPALIVGFLCGPFWGELVVIVRTLIKIPFTSSLCVGEIADLIIGTFAVITSSIFYQHHKTRDGALKSLTIGGFSWVIIACLINYLFIFPFYMELYFNASPEMFIEIYNLGEVFEYINTNNYMIYYILCGILPFNFILSAITTVVTFFVYKRISNIYHRKDLEENSLTK